MPASDCSCWHKACGSCPGHPGRTPHVRCLFPCRVHQASLLHTQRQGLVQAWQGLQKRLLADAGRLLEQSAEARRAQADSALARRVNIAFEYISFGLPWYLAGSHAAGACPILPLEPAPAHSAGTSCCLSILVRFVQPVPSFGSQLHLRILAWEQGGIFAQRECLQAAATSTGTYQQR